LKRPSAGVTGGLIGGQARLAHQVLNAVSGRSRQAAASTNECGDCHGPDLVV
jgi:hypothetical protein